MNLSTSLALGLAALFARPGDGDAAPATANQGDAALTAPRPADDGKVVTRAPAPLPPLTKTPAAPDFPRLAIKCTKVFTADEADHVVDNAVILISNGKVEKVGRESETPIPDGYTVLDKTGMWAAPGYVDCHDHVGGGLMDLNDGVYLSNPGLRSIDTIDPENGNVKDALAGGVTTVLVIPGSGNNMSGFGTIIKTAGHTLDDVLVRYPGSLKIAQSGNPERWWLGPQRSFMNWNTRETLLRAKKYHEKWKAYEASSGKLPKPAFDPYFADFRGLFDRKFPVTVHTQIYQVVAETIQMLNDELKLWAVLDHSEFDACRLGAETAQRDMFVIVGPRVLDYDRRNRTIRGLAARWFESSGGKQTKIGVNTDAPVLPQEDLPLQSAMAVRFGLPRERRIPALTRIPAQALGIWDRVGSLEPGKDADVGLWTGDPVDPASACLVTIVNGRIAYDAKTMGRRY
jgi:imidazolonepropionase-like amidohydrolase